MKILKWIVVVLAGLALLFYFVGMPYLREQTKKHSPEKTAVFAKNGMDLTVKYNSPFKKDRVIFGELVPYDVVWRTGANEPTTFSTTTDIMVIDKKLAAGTYSLWTKPGKDSWLIIFNNSVADWGVTLSSGGSETTRNSEHDALQVEVPVSNLSQAIESFTIDFEESDQLYLSLAWDRTKVNVPMSN